MNVWRDRINRWLNPLARRLPISPNLLTGLGLTFNLAAAFLLGTASLGSARYLYAVAILAVGGVMDALDGAVARAQSRTSRWGDFLDHLFDRVSDGALLAAWTIGTDVRLSLAAITLLAVSLNGYIGTQIEASFGEREYGGTGRGEFVLALFIMPLAAYSLERAGLSSHRVLGCTIAELMTLGIAAFATLGLLQRFMRAKGLSTE